MANSTVQSNANISSGSRALRSKKFTRSAEGVYEVVLEYVCLPSSLDNYVTNLTKGSLLTGISTPAGTPRVISIDYYTENGLSYISVRGAVVDANYSKYLTKSKSQGTRSFSASDTIAGTQVTRSFDYWATTVQLTANLPITAATYFSEVDPSSIYNDRGTTAISPSVVYDWQPVTTLGPNGITVYSGTLTGSYTYP